MTGKVKWFNDKKGYGFITDSEGKDVFVHYSSILMNGRKSLHEDDFVEFEIGEGTTGREQAINVAVVKSDEKQEESQEERNYEYETKY